jgi:hypothetical protein
MTSVGRDLTTGLAVPSGTSAVDTRSALRVLFAYRLVSRAYFHLPVLFVYLYLEDVGVGAIETLLALYGLAIVVGGLVAPKVNAILAPGQLLAAGEASKLVGLLLIGFLVGGVSGVAVGQVLSGLGYALTASAEGPLVGRLVPDRQQAARLQATTQSWIFAVVMVSGVVGAVIFDREPRVVFVLSALACAVAGLLARRITVPPAAPRGTAARASAAAISSSARWWAAYYVIVRSVSLACFVGVLPYVFFVDIEVSLAYFGAVLGVFNLAAFLAARWFSGLSARLGDTALTVGTLLSVTGALALFAATDRLDAALVAIALLGLGAGGARPLTARGQSDVPPEARGRLSVRTEQVTGLANAVVLLTAGVALAGGERPALLGGLAAAVALAGVAFLVGSRATAPEPAGAPATDDARR